MRVSFSVLSFLPLLRYPAKEVYSVCVSDIQAFVEKRANVFNYMLLDPSLDLPDPATLGPLRGPTSPSGASHSVSSRVPSNISDVPSSPISTPVDPTEEKANKLMKSFMGTLSRAGRAANESGVAGLEKAVREQKRSFISAVKHVQRRVEDGSTSLEDVTREGVAVMKKMQKGIAENMGELKEKMSTFSNPPPKKKGWVSKPAKDLFRIGGVVIRDLRVFMRNMVAAGTVVKNSKGWHKPILFKEVVVSAGELSSPGTRRDAVGCPVVGLNVPEVSRVLQKRMVAETGRTNGTVLLQSAFGEVFEVFAANKGCEYTNVDT